MADQIIHAYLAVTQLAPDDDPIITCRCGWSGPIDEWTAHKSAGAVMTAVVNVAATGGWRQPDGSLGYNPDDKITIMASDTDTPKIPEMVERVARAIVAKIEEQSFGTISPTPEADPEFWENARGVARAAIAAMREPTEAMSEAGKEESLSDGAHDCEVPMSQVYRAMIDTALNE